MSKTSSKIFKGPETSAIIIDPDSNCIRHRHLDASDVEELYALIKDFSFRKHIGFVELFNPFNIRNENELPPAESIKGIQINTNHGLACIDSYNIETDKYKVVYLEDAAIGWLYHHQFTVCNKDE